VSGRHEGMVVMVVDLRERHKARDQERRLHELVDSLDDVFVSVDLTGNQPAFMSKAATRLFGRPAHELQGDHTLWRSMLHPEDAGTGAAWREALWAGKPAVGEARIVRPDGSVRNVR